MHASATTSRIVWPGILLASAGAVAFSGKAIIVKLSYRYGVDAVTVIMYRMLFAMPLFLTLSWWAGRGKPALTARDWKSLAWLGFCGYYLASFLDFAGLAYVTASFERLVLYLNPTIVLLLGWVLFGRKAMGEAMTAGLFRDRWRIRRQGRLVHAEEARFEGDVADLTARQAVLAGAGAFATLLYCGPQAEALLPQMRALFGDAVAGASHWQDKLVARVSAADGFALRKILIPVISHLRKGASLPKVWTL